MRLAGQVGVWGGEGVLGPSSTPRAAALGHSAEPSNIPALQMWEGVEQQVTKLEFAP